MTPEASSDPSLVAEAATPDQLQAAADARREARDWLGAARLYAEVVVLKPEAWGLTVQEGHCLKESGDVAAALARYKAAEHVAPEDADLQLQIGHAHKLLGHWQDAALAYARAVALDPGNPDAWREASASAEWLLNQGPASAGHDLLATTEAGGRPTEFVPPAPLPIEFVPLAPLPAGFAAPLPASPMPVAPAPVALAPAALAPAALAQDALAQDALAQDALALAPPGAMAVAEPRPRAALHPVDIVGEQVVLDVTDVLDYFNGARAPTGIQRVQIGIVNRAIAEGAPDGMTLCFAAYHAPSLTWHAVDGTDFARVCALSASGFETDDPEWVAARDLLARKVAQAPVLGFAPGAMLVNLGNSWGFAEYFRALRRVQRDHGVRYVPFIHDCVPLIVPEHCLLDTVQLYSRWFGGVALHAHGMLCNSENTLRDVRDNLHALLPDLDLPGHVVRLDADPRAVSTATLPETTLAALRVLRPKEEFALFVSTIESRKNHLLVFNAWLQLLRKHGPAKVPRLVCVGRLGWHSEAALSLLQNAPELQRHVVLLSKISDQELDALYERCAFTVYNSHYEGWGLPVTEALAHGKIVVTARHSALVEAGGEAAIYFTPQSQPDLQDKLERVMLDRDYRAAQEAIVRDMGRPRSWSAVKDEALSAVLEMARRPAHPLEDRLRLQLGKRYRTRNAASSRPRLDHALADAVRDGTGWYPAEEWGVWCRAGLSTLRLPLPPEAVGAGLRLYLEFQTPPAAMPVELRCSLDGAATVQLRIPMVPGRDTTFMVDLAAVPEARMLDIELDNGVGIELAAVGVNDPRTLGAALRGFMLCRHDDFATRLAYLESQSFLMAQT